MGKPLSILLYGILAVFLFFSASIAALGVRNIWRGVASTRWPKAAGVVTTSDLTQTETFNKKTWHNDTDYSAALRFRYNVNGRDYTTSLLYFGQTLGSGDPTEAQLRHLRFPEDSTVAISYNPSDPSISAVEPGFHAESLWLLIAGLFFGLPCIMAGAIYATSLTNSNLGMTIGIGLFAVLFAIAGIAALTFGLTNLWLGHASEHWPKAPGMITYQKVAAEEVEVTTADTSGTDTNSTDDASAASSSSPSGHETTYTDYLVFCYEVDGKKRYSNLRRFGLVGGGTEADAEKLKAHYPEGMPVMVAYSPENPDLAVLEPGIEKSAWWMPGVGGAILLFVTAICVWALPSVARSP